MGAARLLAKGWIAFCVFAGAHALARLMKAGPAADSAIAAIAVCVALFGAMGLMFIAGYGASSGGVSRLKPGYFLPGFNEIVFIAFAVIVFIVQIAYTPGQDPGGVLGALETAVRAAIPGQRALEQVLTIDGLDAGRNFASATAWLLAFVLLGSSLSRLRLSAALLRLERKGRAPGLGPASFTAVLGIAAMVLSQFLIVGSLYSWIPADMLGNLPGTVLIGLGPLALAYLIVAALTNLWALSPEA
jgi:hypothetical protein